MTDEVAVAKQFAHAVWATGDFAHVARLSEEVGKLCAARAAAGPGVELLDVATGTGNVAIPAAVSGARVTGLDLTPELFGAARRRAVEAGVEVDWIEGDAEALPFADRSFDSVTSTFGVQFAPRHQVAAAELARVCRPAGRIVLCNWTLEGMIGQAFDLMASYMPPPPSWSSPAALWGDEQHVREVFEGTGVELTLERRTVKVPFETPDAYVEYFERWFGPMITARKALEPKGKWADLRRDYGDLVRRFHRDGAVHQEYFVIEGRLTPAASAPL